ncbi:MAG: hypothetical protein JXR31_09915, partial [Prolixibacteraceae bacterium]|nr:hypothetical protein [Prolixibacteraceae bacterium]
AKRLQLYGLIRECPMGKPLSDCPVNEYRNLSLIEQYQVAESLEYELLCSILFYHEVCLSLRETR